MIKSHFFTKKELQKILSDTVNKTLGEIDKNNVFEKTKKHPKITGIAGDVIEQSVLGYPPDRAQRPDLDVDGVLTELKTTGIRLKKTKSSTYYEAKEPASITAVSIDTIAKERFESSAFWHKAEHILFVFYQYESSTSVMAAEYANFHIRGFCFNKFSEDDIAILRKDWQLIHDFIQNIQENYDEESAKKEYPNLSTIINKKTTYLDTAPKYPNPPRFRLRRRVVTVIVQETFGENLEKLPDRYLSMSDIEKKCANISNKFGEQTLIKILSSFDFDINQKSNIKQLAEQAIVRMFGGKSKKISKIEVFRKFGYIGKTMVLTSKGTRTEDMKLWPVDFDDFKEKNIIDEDGIQRTKMFEDSDLYANLHDHKLLCILFKEQIPKKGNKVVYGDNIFMGFKVIDLTDEDIMSEAKKTWQDTTRLIQNNELDVFPVLDKLGNPIINKNGLIKQATNLPKSKNHVIFFKGTGNDSSDKVCINGKMMLRQNYWIKGSFLAKKLSSIPFIK